MNARSIGYSLVAGWTITAMIGCGMNSDTITAIQEAVTTVSAAESQPALPLTEPLAEATFDAPYPDRIEPFAFPTDSNEAASDDVADKSTQIDVVGFAELDNPRVLLRISGLVHALRVGESEGGVEVVAINRPIVRLKRGNLTWNATMFNYAQRH